MSASLEKIKHGVGWGGLSVAANFLLQLGFMYVMARLLEPADFGLMALALVGLRFLSYFAQLGITPAIIQKNVLTDGDIAAALSVTILISGFFYAACVVAAPWLSTFYGMPELAPIARMLALNFILNGLSAISMGLLRREARFKQVSIIETLAYTLGYVLVGLTLAHFGFGVWALVWANLAQAAAVLILGYAVTRHSLRLRHAAAERNHFLHFGGRYSVIGFLEFLTSNLDSVVIGKLAGAGPAGIYSRALLLANLPVEKPANVISRALFPTLCALSGRKQDQYVGYLLSTLIVGAFAFSVSIGVSTAAGPIVLAVLGAKWEASIPVLQVLALSVGPIFTTHIASVTLDSMGQLTPKLVIQSCSLALLAVLFYLVNSYGLVAFAAAVVVVEWLRMAVFLTLMRKRFEGVGEDWIGMFSIFAILSMCVACSILLVTKAVPEGVHLIELIFSICAGVVGLAIGLLLSRPLLKRMAPIQWLLARHELVRRLVGA
ncbi:lipopolysaccharide biosynthesis protein [Lysobacter sp. P5_B9]